MNTLNVSFSREKIAAIATWAAVGLFLLSLFLAVMALGEQFRQPVFIRVTVSVSTCLAIVGHAMAAWQPLPRARIVHGTAFAAWMLIAVAMTVFYVLSQAPELLSKQLELTEQLFSLGRTLYSALMGVGLVVTLTAIIVDEAGRRPLRSSPSEAFYSVAANAAVLLAVVSSSIHILEFGARVAQTDAFTQVTAMAIADLAFIAIKFALRHQLEMRRTQGVYDVFDLVAWGVFGALLAAYLMAINAASVYSRTVNVELYRSEPFTQFLISLYGMSPTILLAGIAMLQILTGVVDFKSAKRAAASQILTAANIADARKVGDDA